MRMLMNVILPSEPFNNLVRNGTAGLKIKQILGKMKPEAAYFTEQHGNRGGIFVVRLDDASEIPALAEPWFLSFDAEVEFRIVMSPEDLERADLGAIGKKWGSSEPD
jgi:hypothetical protein